MREIENTYGVVPRVSVENIDVSDSMTMTQLTDNYYVIGKRKRKKKLLMIVVIDSHVDVWNFAGLIETRFGKVHLKMFEKESFFLNIFFY